MSQTEAIRRIVEALDRAGIPYMLTGSFASSYHGVPRASQDIDLVVAPSEAQLRLLIGLLPQNEYYADLGMALDAARRESQCNILDLVTGWKADLIFRKSRPFSMAEFDRRTEADVQGLRVFVATPEDVVLSKLEWAKKSDSQRQIEDAAGLLRARAADLDREYIARWVRELGLESEWRRACELAGTGG